MKRMAEKLSEYEMTRLGHACHVRLLEKLRKIDVTLDWRIQGSALATTVHYWQTGEQLKDARDAWWDIAAKIRHYKDDIWFNPEGPRSIDLVPERLLPEHLGIPYNKDRKRIAAFWQRFCARMAIKGFRFFEDVSAWLNSGIGTSEDVMKTFITHDTHLASSLSGAKPHSAARKLEISQEYFQWRGEVWHACMLLDTQCFIVVSILMDICRKKPASVLPPRGPTLPPTATISSQTLSQAQLGATAEHPSPPPKRKRGRPPGKTTGPTQKENRIYDRWVEMNKSRRWKIAEFIEELNLSYRPRDMTALIDRVRKWRARNSALPDDEADDGQ